MKRFSLFAVLLVVPLLLMASAPMVQEPGGGLTEGQLMIIGLVASAIVWLLKLLASQGYNPPKEAVAVGLYVVSFLLAIGFTPVAIPPFPPFSDAPTFVAALLSYAGQLLALAAPVVGIAYLIYNVLLKRILETVKAKVSKAIG